MADQQIALYTEFLKCTSLSEKHREYLRTVRGLQDEFIEGNFISGTPENIVPAVEQIKKRYGALTAAENLHVVVKTDQGCQPDPQCLKDQPLIIYRNQAGEPFMVKQHKMLPEGAVPQPFGLHMIRDSTATTVVTEGEYKCLLLNQLGAQALAVPGVSIFNDQHYIVMRDHVHDLGLKKVVFLFDNADRRSPALPNGQPNPKYVSDKKRRVDVEYGQLHLGRRLEFDVEGLEVHHARLPDASRINGEADIDGVIVGGTLTPDELLRLIAEPFNAEEFISQLHPEEQETLRYRLGLGDKEFRAGGKTYFELRRWPLKVVAKSADKGRWGIQADVTLEVNGVDVHATFMHFTENKCKAFAKEAEARLSDKIPAFRVMELTGKVLPLLQDLGLAIGRAMEKAKKVERKKAEEKAKKFDDAQVGDKSYLYAPGEIVLQLKKSERVVANFFMRITHDVQVEDDLDVAHKYRAELVTGGKTLTIEFPAEERLNKTKMEAHFGAAAPDLWVDDLRAVTDVAAVISTPEPLRLTRNFGYRPDGAYIAQSIIIQPDGKIVPNTTVPVDLRSIQGARYLDPVHIDDDTRFRELARHVFDDILGFSDFVVGSTGLAHVALVPLVARVAMGNRYFLFYDGSSGDSKSLLGIALQCFFGRFDGEGCVITWASTPNDIEKVGYYFRHAIYCVNDWKRHLLGKAEPQALRVLQSYADGVGRGRLDKNAQTRGMPWIRGLLLLTGEDVPRGEASIIARGLYVTMPKRGCEIRGPRIMEHQHEYSAITTRYVARLMSTSNAEIKARFEEHKTGFLKGIHGRNNDIRIAGNLAQSMVGFQYLMEFFRAAGVISEAERVEATQRHREALMALRGEMVHEVASQKTSSVFVRLLAQLIATGEARIEDEGSSAQSENRVPVVGFRRSKDPEIAYVLPEKSFAEVRRRYPDHRLAHSEKATGQQLHSDGLLMRGGTKGGWTVRPRLAWRATPPSCWPIKATALGFTEEPRVETSIGKPGQGKKGIEERLAEAARGVIQAEGKKGSWREERLALDIARKRLRALHRALADSAAALGLDDEGDGDAQERLEQIRELAPENSTERARVEASWRQATDAVAAVEERLVAYARATGAQGAARGGQVVALVGGKR